jgi:hypothetical protein
MNWLERARYEIRENANRPTANTAERNPTALMAVPDPAIGADPQRCAHKVEDQTSRRARREIQERTPTATANSADRSLTAVMAVADPAFQRACVHAMGVAPENLPLRAMLEEFEERAAIMEFDGGLSRQDEEREAASALIRRYRLH